MNFLVYDDVIVNLDDVTFINKYIDYDTEEYLICFTFDEDFFEYVGFESELILDNEFNKIKNLIKEVKNERN